MANNNNPWLENSQHSELSSTYAIMGNDALKCCQSKNKIAKSRKGKKPKRRVIYADENDCKLALALNTIILSIL